MGSAATIYARLIGSRMRAQAQYRGSFALGIVGNAVLSYLDLLNIVIFFNHVVRLGGWSFGEIAFLYGSSYIGLRLGDLTVGHVEYLPNYIRTGSFDTFLIRPLGSLFQVVSADFSLRQVGGLIQGVVIFVYAIARAGIDWTSGKVVMTGVMVLSGYAIFVGIWIATNSISFWLIDTREVANAFTYGGNFVSQYPFHIFGAWIRRFFTVVVPIGFINYFPALYILGKRAPFEVPGVMRFLSPVVALATWLVAATIWRAGVRSYRSTGS